MELEHLPCISRNIGQTLNLQEQSMLEMGLIKRRATENLLSIRFWGKIYGSVSDYIIAVAVIKAENYPTKKFFFCTNTSPELQQFPEVSADNRKKASKLTGRLRGDPAFPLEEVEEPEGSEGKGFREVDRLVCMVEEIDQATAILPCGAYLMEPSHTVVPNRTFEGLSWDKATSLDNYFHFRNPQEEERKAVLKSNGLVRNSDFFDPVSSDLKISWSIQTDNTKTSVILRNLYYPGHVFFHTPRTNKYGMAYFGDGLKNRDLAFMV